MGTLASPADPRENTRGLAPTVVAEAATLQTNVLVGRGEDGQDETWALTPARWPLPRHYFARLVFIARAFSYVGSLLKRQGQGNPLRLWGQR